MPTLAVPEKVRALAQDHEAMEVLSWDDMADRQLADGSARTTLEIGEVLAMQDRECFMADWSADSRRIFAVRWNEEMVGIYDAEGELVDEPGHHSNKTQ